ncbi:secondary thiamine-phosphate synthase enzyme YjbQ [Halorhodospira sp. 9622]|uniref:secondary thiamine-phosphate synthase enzyme YjbQ n=1 Tax=Halorhodospira sp. 9622 TaxID=2899136 RepID=UPI001EE8174C|nr:secondary thiamine-phosphate synthase enzyme YjbQ [Halorhodospira sp. 9622]MCG5538003.1 secondary thiamine-phosphate synthase enzyme YjbQ [Halorhodospira sp. 9622]
MKIEQQTLTVQTRGRGTHELTRRLADAIGEYGVSRGLAHAFCHHTSASLMITENADPSVRADLERFMARVAPDGDPMYEHDMEGPDDMPAHIRSILTGSGVTIPISGGRPALGTWQGLYLWEHRSGGHARRVTLTLIGE